MSESDNNKNEQPEDASAEEKVDQAAQAEHIEHTEHTENSGDENGPVNVGHQDNDLHLNTVKRFMIGSFAVTLAFFVLMLGVHRFYKSAFTKDRGGATEETRQIAQKDDALLQTQPLVDLEEYNEIEEERLNTTADAGEHAVIPVEAAKQLMLKEQAFPTPTPEKAEVAESTSPMVSPMVADMDEESAPETAAPAQTETVAKAESAPKSKASAPVAPGPVKEPVKEDPAMIAAGKAIWEANCIVCHSGKKGAIGPNIHKAYGTMRQLENGQSILMDDDYVLNSMNNPTEHIAKGYQPVMMSFKQQLTDQQKQQVTAYLRSMGKPIQKSEPAKEEQAEEAAPAPAEQAPEPAPAPAKETAPPTPAPTPAPEPEAPAPAPKPEKPSGAIFV